VYIDPAAPSQSVNPQRPPKKTTDENVVPTKNAMILKDHILKIKETFEKFKNKHNQTKVTTLPADTPDTV
jgi:hypothetical protein